MRFCYFCGDENINGAIITLDKKIEYCRWCAPLVKVIKQKNNERIKNG